MARPIYEIIVDNGPKCNEGKCMAVFEGQRLAEQAEQLLAAVGIRCHQAGGASGIMSIMADSRVVRPVLDPWYDEGHIPLNDILTRKGGDEDWDEIASTDTTT